ncbi:HAMP domain-containing protein [candidate division KSB1 bacterium]|nr:HAMP domain-containing protein [candidate division KSB1 bacterium]
MFKKYKWNFVFVLLVVSIVGFAIIDIIFYYSIKSFLYDRTSDEMRTKTHLAVMWFRQKELHSFPDSLAEVENLTRQIKEIVNSRVTIIAADGRVITDSDVEADKIKFLDNHIKRPEIQEALLKGWGQSYRESDTVKLKLFYTAFLIKNGHRNTGFLRLAYYAKDFENSLDKVLTSILIANIIGIAILFLSALFLASVVTHPILRIAKIAKKISDGDLERDFPVHRTDEIGMLTTVLNQLTHRLKTQIKQISNERTKLESILTNLDIGVVVVDKEQNIIQVNPEIARILGRKDGDVKKKTIRDILRSASIKTAIAATLEKKDKESGEFICKYNHQKLFLSYVVTPFQLQEDETWGALIQLHNITELKRLEAIRRDFVANASHELKTPLTAIMGYSETLMEGAVEDQQSRMKFIRRIREQAQRLEFLVADLLKLSEVERETPPQLQDVRLDPLVNEILEEFSEAAEQKKIKMVCKSPKKLMAKIDEVSIRTVFGNLIDNAIKYTPPGGTITVRSTSLENHRIRIEIIDTGIGIERKYHERIFQRFYRVDKARSRALGGTGLGLAIVKHIIEQHGSKIHVQSESGNGSCFWFELKAV